MQLLLDKDRPVPTAQAILTQPQLDQPLGLSRLMSSSPSVSQEVRCTGSYVPLWRTGQGVLQLLLTLYTINTHSMPGWATP